MSPVYDLGPTWGSTERCAHALVQFWQTVRAGGRPAVVDEAARIVMACGLPDPRLADEDPVTAP